MTSRTDFVKGSWTTTFIKVPKDQNKERYGLRQVKHTWSCKNNITKNGLKYKVSNRLCQRLLDDNIHKYAQRPNMSKSIYLFQDK